MDNIESMGDWEPICYGFFGPTEMAPKYDFSVMVQNYRQK